VVEAALAYYFLYRLKLAWPEAVHRKYTNSLPRLITVCELRASYIERERAVA
jgi:hypothetical protein